MSTASTASIPITSVRDRSGNGTRQLDPVHVVALLESIGALALLEPLVLDRQHRLLAGAHRRAACLLLSEADSIKRRDLFIAMAGKSKVKGMDALVVRVQNVNRSGWESEHADGQVPVRVIDIDAAKNPDEALRVELGENGNRKDYSRDEVLALAGRLRATGYVDRRGRPKRGEKAMQPALAAIIGKSIRHLSGVMSGRHGQVMKISIIL